MSQYSPSIAEVQGEILCDLRSDTVTQPDIAMRAAMAAAEVGDDVYGEDPTVARLEATLAERFGKEAGVFVPTGTQSNLIAMLAHCGRGEEVITGRAYHVFKYEAAGASVLGGCALYPLEVMEDGGLDPRAVAGAVKEDDSHHAISRLLSVENTHNGKPVALTRCQEVVDVARAAGLATHLDGARVFNAIVAMGCDETALTAPFDTVSICLSKGLGAPVGSVLVGPEALLAKARRLRKMLGGGMRQAGILAAAGLYALEHNVERLSEDHARTDALAEALHEAGIGPVEAGTNMVFVDPNAEARGVFARAMAEAGVKLSASDQGPIRLVLHKDVTDEALNVVMAAMRGM